MSVNRYISVVCDTCQIDASPEQTITQARKSAKAEGFTRHKSWDIDHCPNCEIACREGTR